MASIAHNTAPILSGFRPIKAVTTFFADVARAGHAAARFQHLSSLSDFQLKEMGYTRSQAAHVAFDESFGKL